MTKVNNIQNIGEKIKAKRKKERLSAEDLATKLGLKSTNIYKWERGSTPSNPEEYMKITQWLNNLESTPIHKTAEDDKVKVETKASNNPNPYLKLLEDNDRFFKTEYHNLLISLNKILEIGMRSEELIKLNLEHVGNVEAHLKEVDPDIVHEQINNQIAGMGAVEQKDMYAGK